MTRFELLVIVGRLAWTVMVWVPSSVPLRKAMLALIGLGRRRSLVDISLTPLVLMLRPLLRTWWTLISPFLPRAVMMTRTDLFPRRSFPVGESVQLKDRVVCRVVRSLPPFPLVKLSRALSLVWPNGWRLVAFRTLTKALELATVMPTLATVRSLLTHGRLSTGALPTMFIDMVDIQLPSMWSVDPTRWRPLV